MSDMQKLHDDLVIITQKLGAVIPAIQGLSGETQASLDKGVNDTIQQLNSSVERLENRLLLLTEQTEKNLASRMQDFASNEQLQKVYDGVADDFSNNVGARLDGKIKELNTAIQFLGNGRDDEIDERIKQLKYLKQILTDFVDKNNAEYQLFLEGFFTSKWDVLKTDIDKTVLSMQAKIEEMEGSIERLTVLASRSFDVERQDRINQIVCVGGGVLLGVMTAVFIAFATISSKSLLLMFMFVLMILAGGGIGYGVYKYMDFRGDTDS